jgi:hypothetical protein
MLSAARGLDDIAPRQRSMIVFEGAERLVAAVAGINVED